MANIHQFGGTYNKTESEQEINNKFSVASNINNLHTFYKVVDSKCC